ncbi:MAG: NifB/NifX family molybdenum-iron cluster-binding protein [Bacteroidales bacterium]
MEKYLVASSGDSLDSKISGRFGHAKYYLVIFPQTMDFEVFPGVSTDKKTFGVARFINFGITKIITGNIGPSTFSEAVSNEINVYLCRKMTVREAVNKVANDEITPLEEPTLKKSIHSAQKREWDGSGQGKGFNIGLGRGLGRRGKGKGKRKK